MAELSIAAADTDSTPHAYVQVSSLGSTPVLLTVWRSVNGLPPEPVRGATKISAAGSLLVRDFEIPLNLNVTYTLEVAGASNNPQATLRIDSPTAWIQNPLAPRAAIKLEHGAFDSGGHYLRRDSFSSVTTSQPTDVVTPMGARLPVASIGTRTALEGIPLTISRHTGDTGALDALLRSSGVLLLRGLPEGIGLPSTSIFILPGQVRHSIAPGQIPGGWSTWSMTVREVAAPAISIIIPWWTYQQIKTAWSPLTYAQVKAARPSATYLPWLKNPERV